MSSPPSLHFLPARLTFFGPLYRFTLIWEVIFRPSIHGTLLDRVVVSLCRCMVVLYRCLLPSPMSASLETEPQA